MALSTLVFWLVVLMTATSAMVVVLARNILHAAFALCMSFLGVGALYVFLHADFVAAVQLIVYVGGILVLIMFAVMFSSNLAEDSAEKGRSRLGIGAGALAAAAVFSGILLTLQRLEVPLAARNTHGAVDYVNTVGVTPTTISRDQVAMLSMHNDILLSVTDLSDAGAKEAMQQRLGATDGEKLYLAWQQTRGHYGLGHKLMGEFLLPFEVVSVLLLAALIGAVVIVRKELS